MKWFIHAPHMYNINVPLEGYIQLKLCPETFGTASDEEYENVMSSLREWLQGYNEEKR